MTAADRPEDLRTRLVTIGGELTFVLLAFVAAGLILSVIPPLRTGLDWLARQLFGPPTVSPAQWKVVVAILLTPLATLLAALAHRRISRLWPDPPAPFPPKTSLATTTGQVILHLLLAVLGSYILAIAMHLLGSPVVEQALVVQISRGPLLGPEVAVLATSAVLIAPLAEELLFRGQLFRRLAARVGLPAAYATTALLFAVIHFNLHGFVVYAWLGLVFARVYAVTGRLGAAVAVHLGNNAITLAALLFGPAPGSA